ncbi:SDR family oxidoreductase [Nibrella saemangeumensis]|uniref:SDR family oxidoreductase n=1 Tax=Nibrella saemangeumensis TaxID=1084526 RepID=A0ABP8MDW9_9BACT
METFTGKIIFITGAASGIGRELADQLAEKGAVVVATDINGAAVEAVADDIQKQGGIATSYQLDVTDYQAVKTLIRYIANRYGQLDYAFCNAGISVAGEVRDVPMHDWHKVLAVNLNGVIHTATEAYKVMVNQGFGHVVTTASLAGLVYQPTLIPYVTTKHAVVAFSRSLRLEGKALGVKVSSFCPGFIATNIYESSLMSGTSVEDSMKLNPFRLVAVEDAVSALLKGVAANRELILLPFYSHALSWLTRHAYPLIRPLLLTNLTRYRQIRKEPSKAEEPLDVTAM